MPRPLRAAFANATYHITARGNNSESLFRDTYDRYDYLSILARLKGRLPIRIFAYALLTNHIHLVLQTPDANVSSAMRLLHGAYAAGFNRKYKRTGHLFGGRFRSRIIDDDQYLLEATRYVHLNPVRAGLAESPEDYPWSSYRLYVSPEVQESFIDPRPVLGLLSAGDAASRGAYARFVIDRVEKQEKAFRSSISDAVLARIVEKVALSAGYLPNELLTLRSAGQPRGLMLLLAREVTGMKYDELADTLGLKPSSVRMAVDRLRHLSAVDSTVRRDLSALRRAIRRQDGPPARNLTAQSPVGRENPRFA